MTSRFFQPSAGAMLSRAAISYTDDALRQALAGDVAGARKARTRALDLIREAERSEPGVFLRTLLKGERGDNSMRVTQ